MHVCEEAVKKLKVVSSRHMLGFFHSCFIPVIATEKTNKTQGDFKKEFLRSLVLVFDFEKDEMHKSRSER